MFRKIFFLLAIVILLIPKSASLQVNVSDNDLVMMGDVLSNEKDISDNDEVDLEKEKYKKIEDEFFVAKVIKVVKEEKVNADTNKVMMQVLQIEGLYGKWKGVIVLTDEIHFDVLAKRYYEKGDKVIAISSYTMSGENKFYVTDYYRLNRLYILAGVFIIAVLLLAKWKGLRALLALSLSFAIIIFAIIPAILNGYNLIVVAFLGSSLILFLGFYLIYGFKLHTHISVASTFICLLVAMGLILLFTKLCLLSGYADEEVLYLTNLNTVQVSALGVLLAAMIIGILGMLDDIIINQVSVVEELKRANPKYGITELYNSAYQVGVNHVSSIINTLFMAYTGSSLSLFLLFSVRSKQQLPLFLVLNGELIATEIVRMLVGSLAVLLAVPLSTYIAALIYAHKKSILKREI